MKRVAIIVAVIATIGLLWVGGELHRQNCVDSHLAGCSILPWESGHAVLGPPSLNGSTGYLLPSNGYALGDQHYMLP